MQTIPVHAPPPPPWRSRWLVALSLFGIAAAGITRFNGRPYALPLDEAMRTLVTCPSQNERELALAVLHARASEILTMLAMVERQGDRAAVYSAAWLDQLQAQIAKERSR